MAEVDTGLYNALLPKPGSGLEMAGRAQSLQQGALNNRLLGQEVAGKIAQGRAAQAAIDQATGKFDPDTYMKNLANDPMGAQQAPQAAIQAQQQRQAQLQADIAGQQLSQDQLKTSQIELENGGKFAQGMLASGITSKDALTKAGDAMVPLIFKTDGAKEHWDQFKSKLTDDPNENAKLLQQFTNNAMDVSKALGEVHSLQAGGKIIQVRNNPATGAPEVVGAINTSRTPSEKAVLVPTYDSATGKTSLKTSGEIVGDADAPAAMHPQTGPALGEAQTAAANVDRAQALEKRAAMVPVRKAALSNMVDTLDKFTPGVKADLTYQIGALAAMTGRAPPSTTKGVAAQEEFNKLSAQIALDQWGTLGGTGSNEQLATAMKANPNQTMSKMGIKNVAALLQGNEDAIGAQNDAWTKYSAVHGPASYGKFQAGWNKYYDPRVFQAEHMTPAAVTEMRSKMTKDQRDTFDRDKAIAQKAGWLGQ